MVEADTLLVLYEPGSDRSLAEVTLVTGRRDPSIV